MNTLNLRRRLRLVGALAVSTALTLALLGALFLALRPPAASASGPAPIAAWGTGREPTTSLAVGDMDNDGDLDLVVGNQGEDNRIYLNNGRGGFPTEVRGTITLTNSSPTSVIAVADLNGDGWLDVLALAPGAPAQLYLNAHRGTFTSRLLLTITSPLTPALVIGDLDGDADFDLVVGGANAMTRVYRNDGHAGFSPAPAWLTATEAMSATAMTLADVNGDGRLDLVLGFDGRPVQVFLNRGGARFAPANTIGEARGRVAALAAGDLNGDGKPDLAIAYSDLGSESQSIEVYTTTVTGELAVLAGRSSSLSFTNNDAPMTLALGDVNNDDALDLAVGFGERSGSAATRNQVFLNDGRARFARDDVQYFGSGADRTYAVALADLDDNGSLDFIAANYGERHRIYFAQAGTPQLVFAQAQGESRAHIIVWRWATWTATGRSMRWPE
ncbi:MAG: VCBS repeat-containing protein [Anaerolineae bacterium]|uniref:FG-GAP repeat domain-containing protein n=1 Tax=Candidatus Amarolinea dominans TaxID=3140696 RepID=UPI003134BF58|nr:VCBS repeat-containing protein [Anaerolineae bacterium]